MAETVKTVAGEKQFLLYRILGDNTEATKIAQQTNHDVSSSRDANANATKDGTSRSLGAVEQEVEAEVYLTTADDVNKLKEAHEQGKVVELWDITALKKNEEGKYAATYYQGYITEISASAPTDDNVSVSISFAVEGIGKRGYTALSEAQEAVLDYAFVEANKPASSTPVESH